MMEPYGIHSSFEANGSVGRCQGSRSCPFPGRHFFIHDHYADSILERNLCQFHFRTEASPFSLEYEDADALLGVPRHKGRNGGWGGQKDIQIWSMLEDTWHRPNASGPRTFRKHVTIIAGRAHNERAGVDALTRSLNQEISDIAEEIAPEPKHSHFIDPIYRALDLNYVKGISDLVFRYSLCGEKILKTDISGEPTCERCVNIARAERAMRERPVPKPRPVIVTAPKPVEDHPDFEELLLEGLIDDAAFANRRNWGERGGRAWNDPSQGVQRAKGLRWDRGGVNRKRG